MTKTKGKSMVLTPFLNREDAKGAERPIKPLRALRVFAVKFLLIGSSTSRLNIQVTDCLGVRLDKPSAGIDRVAHEHVEGPV
jgi:hypothetical protein